MNCETRTALNTPAENIGRPIAWWRHVAMWPLSLVLRLWWSTIRMEMAAADLAVITRQGHPILFVLWHNRLFMTPEIVRRFRGGHPLYGLISASKDGDWLADRKS